MKTLVAMLALVVGVTFVGVTFVQADEKAAPAASAAGKKERRRSRRRLKPRPKRSKREHVRPARSLH